VVNGKERSERGLLDMDYESFRFTREDMDDYPADIVTESSERRRMTYVPEGTPVIGYAYMGIPIYDERGQVLWDNIFPAPPADATPYVPFYGENFLVFEEFFRQETTLSIDVYKLLLECVQRIRYNGPTLADFFEVTKILCPGYVYDLSIVPAGRYYRVYYRINLAATVYNRERRFVAWRWICEQKFKLFVLYSYEDVE
jgi:hypothetical protein